MIEIVGTELYQWDTGRSVKITGYEVEYAHFANKGDSKAVKMGVVDIEAKIPDYLLQTGKELCVYAVKDGITLESKSFSVKKRERPEDYVYEDDQRNYIYELIQSAEEATEVANLAAEAATEAAYQAADVANQAVHKIEEVAMQATQEVERAAGNADNATEAANQAAQSAVAASETANEAAIKANQAAKSIMVVGKASGSSIYLDDAIDQPLVGLRVFGKTTQNGKPTPDAPVDLVSVGDGGSVTVNVTGENDAQSMTVATPNGLPGIPVTSGGNYTDANGQQWVCDEIDFAKGVYVSRIGQVTLNGTENWMLYFWDGLANQFYTVAPVRNTSNERGAMCAYYIPIPINSRDGNFNTVYTYANGIAINTLECATVDEWKSLLAERPITVIYILATPIETPLSEEELAAFNALHTYRDHTTVSNDAGAYMELEYVMDTKKYIDSVISGTIIPATVE